MKPNRIILVSLVLFQMIPLFSQSVEFAYDSTGNRLTRTIVVQKLLANSVEFPVIDPKNLNPVEYAVGTSSGQTIQNEESFSDVKLNIQEKSSNENTLNAGEELITIVYPNPSKGLINIDISNLPVDAEYEMKFYDLSGLELMTKRITSIHSEIDISYYKDGIYILRINIYGKIFNWKVVKNHF
jgi:hypothetical protein